MEASPKKEATCGLTIAFHVPLNSPSEINQKGCTMRESGNIVFSASCVSNYTNLPLERRALRPVKKNDPVTPILYQPC